MRDKRHYENVHRWLRYHYGKASTCENTECNGKSKAFQWALIKGKEYEKERDNFMMLCSSCHLKYDMTEGKRKKISEAMSTRKVSDITKRRISESAMGRPCSRDTRIKISNTNGKLDIKTRKKIIFIWDSGEITDKTALGKSFGVTRQAVCHIINKRRELYA